jgi:prepilin peptidase CpaA
LHLAAGATLALLQTVLAGLLTGLLMFLPLYTMRAMAAGDVKLMATVGAFCGPAMTFQISLATYCCGGLLALLIVLWRGKTRAAAVNVGALLRPLLLRLTGIPLVNEPMPTPSVGGMPYALAIALGSFLMLGVRHL